MTSAPTLKQTYGAIPWGPLQSIQPLAAQMFPVTRTTQ
jgi:hypothetical protein